MSTNTLTAQQLRYLDSIIDRTENELLFEVAHGLVSGVTNSAGPGYETKSGGPGQTKEERQRARQSAVPDKPVSEYVKPFLEPHLPQAKERALSFKAKVYQLVCDAGTLKPKDWATDATTGDMRNVVVAVVMALTAEHNVAMSVIMPSVAWLLKLGLNKFCSVKTL